MEQKMQQLSYLEIKVFLSVYKFRKAKDAASDIGLSAVHISRCLNALRKITGDQLFVRKGYLLEPTQRADELAPIFTEIHRQMQKVQDKFSDVDYETADRIFEIYANDEFIWPVLEVIEKDIRSLAPKLRFNVHVLGKDWSDDIASGKIDFVVTYEGFKQMGLCSDLVSSPMHEYLLCRKDHPLTLDGKLTTEKLSRYPLVQIQYFDDLSCPVFVRLCRDDGLTMRIGTLTESMAAAFWKIIHSDSVSIICNQFTKKYISYVPELVTIPIPEDLQERIKNIRSLIRPIGNYLIYSKTQNSPLFIWVKDSLASGLNRLWQKLEDSE